MENFDVDSFGQLDDLEDFQSALDYESPQARPEELTRQNQSGEQPTPSPTESSPKTVACEDCGGIVSRRAQNCPHCGCPVGQSDVQVSSEVGELELNEEQFVITVEDEGPELNGHDDTWREGPWIISIEVNPVDDTKTVTFATIAVSGVNGYNQSPTLLLRQSNTGQEAFVQWADFLGDAASVLTRIGKGKAKTQNWHLSTDSQATFYPGNVKKFIGSLLQIESLAVQVTPYNSNPITAVFNVSGLRSSVKKYAPELL
ncbi:MAG: hypothetical protein CMJ62_02625 [Planctomycetaceae bacterium]|nr:hypothetical protein [Planctomycetaceae bacterium]